MAIIYSYPTVAPTTDDLILGTDFTAADKPTKNFTIASIIDLINSGSSGLGAVIKLDPSAKDPITPFANQSAIDFLNITGTGIVTFPTVNSTNIVNTAAITTASLTASGTIQADTFQTTLGTATWTTTILAGFTSITTTGITLNGTVGGTALVQAMPSVVGGATDKIVSEKGIIDYIVGSPAASDSLAEVLNIGNETQGAVAVVLVGGGTGYTPGIAIAATTVAPAGGTGLTVNINVSAGGVIGSISIAAPGTGYTHADVITVTGGNNDATATLTVVSNDIVVSASDDITFTDSSKILLGNGADGEIYHSGANLLIYNNTGEIRIENQTVATGMLLKTISTGADITMASGRDIIFQSDGTAQRLKIADDGLGWNQLEVGSGDTLALANHVRVWQQAGAGSSPVIRPPYSFMGNTNTGMYDASTTGPTDEGVGLTVNGVGLYQFKTLGFTSTAPFTNSISYTTSTTTGLALMTRFILSTDFSAPETTAIQEFPNDTMIPTNLAVKLYADEVAGAKTLSYTRDAATPASVFTMNLDTDDLQFSNGTNITSVVTDVVGVVADVKFNLNDDVTIVGTMNADTFETTAGLATWSTTIMGGFTSIESDLFVGDASAALIPPIPPWPALSPANVQFQGNASSANILKLPGTVNMTSVAGVTLGPTAPGVTYTSGGNISLVSVLAASTVTGKLLTGISFSTGTAVVATDTILEGIGKLQKQITDLPSGLDYIGTWDARNATERGSGSDGGDPDLRLAGLQVPGHYYIVAIAGSATPNGAATTPNEWKVGDWVIRADATLAEWSKIDNTSEVTTDGSGVATVMPVWNNASELGSSQVQQLTVAARTVTTIVDGGTGGDLTVQGNTLLGSASTDTINSVGVHTIDEQLIVTKGLGVGGTPDYGDTTDKVLTSGNGSVNPPAWTNRSTWGYVESVTEGAGIVLTGDAVDVVVNVDYAGASNVILDAGVAVTPLGTDTIIISDASDTGNVVQALISNLPFDNYDYWTLSDDTTTVNISSTNTAKILGGTGITSTVSVTDKSATIDIDIVGTDNAIAGLTAATPLATDTLWFNDISDSNTIRKATIADIVDLGNETLSEVLSNGNTTGATKISVNNSSSGVDLIDDTKIRFGDIAGTPDLEIYHTAGANSIIKATVTSPTAGPLLIQSDNLELQASSVAEKFLTTSVNAELNLFYNNVKKFETTATGVSVAGIALINGSGLNINSDTIDSLITLNRTTGIWSIDNDSSYYLNFKATSLGTTNLTLKSTGEVQIPDYGLGNNTGTEAYTLGVDSSGNIIETASSGHYGGRYHGQHTTGAASTSAAAFTVQRSGGAIFDVFLSNINLNEEKFVKYTVTFPVGGSATPIWNKILDTGPDDSGSDFTVAFTSVGATLTGTVTAVYTGSQEIGIDIILGYSPGSSAAVAFPNP